VRATGEALQEKVDLDMPDVLLDMRFAYYLEDFADDEGFLQATHQAGLQVEQKIALKHARDQMRTGATSSATRTEEKKKEEKWLEGRRQMEGARNSRTD